MHVESAWSQGATGAGQTIAVIDSAVSGSSFDLTGKVKSDSTDLVTGRTADDTPSHHGTWVAGVIAANFNGVGTVGVAYNSQILSIRADTAGSCATADGCTFNTRVLGQGLDYAVAHGAKIINLSVGADSSSGSSFEAALKRAVDSGAVVVAAAGNDGAAEVDYPARYAVDTRYAGGLIAAGALNSAGTDIATFSNRAGSAAQYYLMAPGEGIRTECDASGSCTIVAGTSFAAPHIAGDLALLMEAFPSLTGKQAVDILLRTATDMGAPGTDAIYGRGMVNMTKAFAPVGSLSVQSPSGTSYEASSASGPSTAAMSSAFGDSVRTEKMDMRTVAYDDYHRMYGVDLAGHIGSAARRSPLAPTTGPVQQTSVTQTLASGASLQLAASQAYTPLYTGGGMTHLTEAGRNQSVMMNYQSGAMRLDLWAGQAGFAPAEATGPADPYSNLAFARQTSRFGYRTGRWTLSAEQGFGGQRDDVLPDYLRDPRAAGAQDSVYARGVAQFDNGPWSVSVTAGLLSEAGGPLGSFTAHGSAFGLGSSTHYVQAAVGVLPMPGLRLSAKASVGDTRANGGALALSARSTSWSLQADAACAAYCTGVSLQLTQPVRVEAGQLSAYLANVPTGYNDPLTYSWRSMSLNPTGRELDLGVAVWRDLGKAGTLQLRANAFTQSGNQAHAPTDVGLTASWSRRF